MATFPDQSDTRPSAVRESGSKGVAIAALIFAVVCIFIPVLGAYLTVVVAALAVFAGTRGFALGIASIIVNLINLIFLSPSIMLTAVSAHSFGLRDAPLFNQIGLLFGAQVVALAIMIIVRVRANSSGKPSQATENVPAPIQAVKPEQSMAASPSESNSTLNSSTGAAASIPAQLAVTPPLPAHSSGDANVRQSAPANEARTTLIVGAVIAVLLLGILGGGGYWYYQKQENERLAALFKAQVEEMKLKAAEQAMAEAERVKGEARIAKAEAAQAVAEAKAELANNSAAQEGEKRLLQAASASSEVREVHRASSSTNCVLELGKTETINAGESCTVRSKFVQYDWTGHAHWTQKSCDAYVGEQTFSASKDPINFSEVDRHLTRSINSCGSVVVRVWGGKLTLTSK